MALPHARSGDVVDVRPLGSRLADTKTSALVKADDFELIRMVLPAGKTIDEHRVDGPLILHCLEGRISLTAHGDPRELAAGELVHLGPGECHALRALEDSSLLLTIVFRT